MCIRDRTCAGSSSPKDTERAFFRRLAEFDPDMIINTNYSGKEDWWWILIKSEKQFDVRNEMCIRDSLIVWLYNHYRSKSINIVHEYDWLFWYILHKFDLFVIILLFLADFSHFLFIFLRNFCFKMLKKKYWYKKQYASLYQYLFLFYFYSLFSSNIVRHAVVLITLTKTSFPEKWFLQ